MGIEKVAALGNVAPMMRKVNTSQDYTQPKLRRHRDRREIVAVESADGLRMNKRRCEYLLIRKRGLNEF
jgi:hypothetical protein